MKKTMIPGILGMLLIIPGIFLTREQRILFLLGALGMTLTALLEGHRLFTGLQLVILSGTLSAFGDLSPLMKGIIPIGVSVPVLIYLHNKNLMDTGLRRLGALALITLGVGFSLQNSYIFFLGGGLISVFSFLEFRSGFKPAIIWLILNLIFTCFTGVSLIMG